MKWLMDVCNRYLIFLFFCVTWKSNEKTWGVCLCFWVVCSLNHRGAKSEELNWIYSRCEQELLCLSILSFVTSRQSSVQHDAEWLNRFVGVRQFTYRHTSAWLRCQCLLIHSCTTCTDDVCMDDSFTPTALHRHAAFMHFTFATWAGGWVVLPTRVCDSLYTVTPVVNFFLR